LIADISGGSRWRLAQEIVGAKSRKWVASRKKQVPWNQEVYIVYTQYFRK
jgi:hypothetical protein